MADQKKAGDKTNSWEEEIDYLKSIVNKTDLVETTKWGGVTYTIDNGKNVIGIGGFKNYFTIWFYNGVFLQDEKKLLVNANEGVTKSLRQWRFTSKSEVDEKLVLAYIAEAIENEKAGKAIKPIKKQVVISEQFQAFLNVNALNDSFQKFPPYKQNEFLEHIGTAKREATQLARFEKMIPMIQNGIGLHDKFRK